jgi:lysophospholipase L1-like esterase
MRYNGTMKHSTARRLAFWAAVPFVAWQALRVRRTATRLPPPAGERRGLAVGGTRRALRVLGLGDSIIAGVGADSPAQALTGAVGAALAERLCAQVDWRAIGESGLAAREVRERLLEQARGERFDAAVVSVGVNDVTGLTRTRAFADALAGLVDGLRDASPRAAVAVLGVPPMDRFPLLPSPLREVLGLRSRLLDDVAAAVVSARPRCVHLPIVLDTARGRFCADGFHPSSEGYAAIGAAAAERIAPLLE